MTSDALEALGRSRYISLTTYRKNGTPVSTPVWVVGDGALLYVWTKTDTWKVKRLRNDKRVVVTACDVRGRIAEGAVSAEGTATLLEESEMPKVRRLLSRKYKWQYWMVDYPAMIARLGKRPHTGIAVQVTQA
ncbi:PPOX class F420-dependent oxidoreductase [Streptomyces sp. YC504]|uniref:PPOX class F420-dependent oxidoreductase n=1 Tax=Streptomyces mesophilus TaxID=1775132 RepID=A0A6G4XG02_9ACTN|nr:PPOX class F420-dependent oxidoreductase [Streptomyces mesophilus]NGO75571.1 PPOX class F420-dependent oxidoreductase [Streptomyces mesophilus]